MPRKIEKEPTEGDYTTIKLPNDLVTSMDKLIGTYGFKSRAEIVKEALRELLTKYKPPLPRYDHFNMGVHGVRITDRQLHRIADIRFSPEGIYCELDESEKCGHIEFALTVPEIKEIIRNKRKEGWTLPDVQANAKAKLLE